MEWYQFALFGVLCLWLTRMFARTSVKYPNDESYIWVAAVCFMAALVLFVLAIATLA